MKSELWRGSEYVPESVKSTEESSFTEDAADLGYPDSGRGAAQSGHRGSQVRSTLAVRMASASVAEQDPAPWRRAAQVGFAMASCFPVRTQDEAVRLSHAFSIASSFWSIGALKAASPPAHWLKTEEQAARPAASPISAPSHTQFSRPNGRFPKQPRVGCGVDGYLGASTYGAGVGACVGTGVGAAVGA